jgi:hypothetical protein
MRRDLFLLFFFLISNRRYFFTQAIQIYTLKLELKRSINELDPDKTKYKIRIEFDLVSTLKFR